MSVFNKNIEFNSVKDAIDSLNIPNLIALDVAKEHDYQIDLYFNIVIKPSITYTYPNEY